MRRSSRKGYFEATLRERGTKKSGISTMKSVYFVAHSSVEAKGGVWHPNRNKGGFHEVVSYFFTLGMRDMRFFSTREEALAFETERNSQ